MLKKSKVFDSLEQVYDSRLAPGKFRIGLFIDGAVCRANGGVANGFGGALVDHEYFSVVPEKIL